MSWRSCAGRWSDDAKMTRMVRSGDLHAVIRDGEEHCARTGAIQDDAEVMVVVEVTSHELQRICAEARIPVGDSAVPMCAQLAARSRCIVDAFVVTDNETGVREVAVTGMTRCQRVIRDADGKGSSGISEKALMVGRTVALSGRMWDRFAEARRDMGSVGEKLWRQVTGRPGRRGIPTAKLVTRILRECTAAGRALKPMLGRTTGIEGRFDGLAWSSASSCTE